MTKQDMITAIVQAGIDGGGLPNDNYKYDIDPYEITWDDYSGVDEVSNVKKVRSGHIHFPDLLFNPDFMRAAYPNRVVESYCNVAEDGNEEFFKKHGNKCVFDILELSQEEREKECRQQEKCNHEYVKQHEIEEFINIGRQALWLALNKKDYIKYLYEQLTKKGEGDE